MTDAPPETTNADPVDDGQVRGRPVHDSRPATITCYPDGPILVRGNVVLTDVEGRALPRRRKTVALCRCGKSGLAPFCDGTHKQIGFRATGS